MAVQRPKVPLNNARFPMLSTLAERSVFVPQLDSAPRLTKGFVGTDDSVDFNTPQIIYGENFMPTVNGVRSVGYAQVVLPSVNDDFDSIFTLRDADENTVLFSPSADKNYIYDSTAGAWSGETHAAIWAPLVVDTGLVAADSAVTYAYVDGKTFVCYSRLKDLVGVAAPAVAAPTTSTTGGTLAAGTYYYQVTALRGTGETLPSAEVSQVTTGATSTVTLTWPAVPDATGYVVYGRVTGGAKLLLAAVVNPTYIDTGAAVPVVGSALPTVNTARYDMSIMQWDKATQTLIPATPLLANLPFNPGTIDGISSSNGFLLLWSGLEVAWAPFNGAAFDFASFANGNFTGAGRQTPEDIKGPITALISVAGGFVIFSSKNAIAANYYSQSIASPWIFREIANAGGIESYQQATVEGNLGDVVAFTTAGMQRLSLNEAKSFAPDVSDFIAGRKSERYDFGTHSLEAGTTTTDMFVKVTVIASRYLVVSYGYYPGVYSYALIYDFSLERWGKLRIVHRDAFYYTQPLAAVDITYSMLIDVSYDEMEDAEYDDVLPAQPGRTTAQHSLAFLLRTGEVKLAVWSDEARDVADDAVVIIGRLQLSRSSSMQFNRAEAEGLQLGNMYVQPSYNGRNLAPAIPLIDVERASGYLSQGELIDCKNFNLVVEGAFHLSTIVLEGTSSGSV